MFDFHNKNKHEKWVSDILGEDARKKIEKKNIIKENKIIYLKLINYFYIFLP